ncbi:Protein RALF-like 33 [Dendrobium catenatum]|uniref:Protein RALF-like 33 n=1 Tax=Dendrobium catenatum TaxID=906689 RepID=A0A2I0VTA7_9ASPA|nr:Protein RALF-like 33 [Dendrobium catenatum]
MRAEAQKAMEMELRRACSLPGVTVLLLLALSLCNTSSTATAMEARIHGYADSSFTESFYLSEWGLDSENGRRLLQTTKYLGYGSLDKDRPAVSPSKPGNAYTRGCEASHYCRG